MKTQTIEQKFVAVLLPRLEPEIVAALIADANEDRMAFARNIDSWGPKRQAHRL